MSTRTFSESHNQIAFLQKHAESDGFAEVIDFLNATHIKYALTAKPTVYISHIKQFWSTIKTITKDGEEQLMAKVDGQRILVSESSVRESLFFAENEEIKCLENATIFKGLKDIGYEKKNEGLKFYKNLLSPQWKFLLHTILHCLSPKTSGWNEFSTTQASAM